MDSILDVAIKTNAPDEQIELLKSATKERRFSKAIAILSDINAIPPVLLISGHNPGVHDYSDAECLERATEAEIILSELARLLQAAISERREVQDAIKKIAARKPKAKTDLTPSADSST